MNESTTPRRPLIRDETASDNDVRSVGTLESTYT